MTMDSSRSRRVHQPNSTTAHQQSHAGPTGLSGLRRARPDRLIAAIHRLDTSVDQASRDEIASYIRSEYEREIGDLPLGFVAVCLLGPPYVDHILDLANTIVEHYASADAMPEPYANARMLVRSGAYAYVEVYLSGTVVPVHADGAAVI